VDPTVTATISASRCMLSGRPVFNQRRNSGAKPNGLRHRQRHGRQWNGDDRKRRNQPTVATFIAPCLPCQQDRQGFPRFSGRPIFKHRCPKCVHRKVSTGLHGLSARRALSLEDIRGFHGWLMKSARTVRSSICVGIAHRRRICAAFARSPRCRPLCTGVQSLDRE